MICEAVQGLQQAKKRLLHFRSTSTGEYLVFDATEAKFIGCGMRQNPDTEPLHFVCLFDFVSAIGRGCWAIERPRLDGRGPVGVISVMEPGSWNWTTGRQEERFDACQARQFMPPSQNSIRTSGS